MPIAPDKGRTLRDAIALALEGLPGHPAYWSLTKGAERAAMRVSIIVWIQDYAANRGVILNPKFDIEPELDAKLAELRVIAIARTKTPSRPPV